MIADLLGLFALPMVLGLFFYLMGILFRLAAVKFLGFIALGRKYTAYMRLVSRPKCETPSS